MRFFLCLGFLLQALLVSASQPLSLEDQPQQISRPLALPSAAVQIHEGAELNTQAIPLFLISIVPLWCLAAFGFRTFSGRLSEAHVTARPLFIRLHQYRL